MALEDMKSRFSPQPTIIFRKDQTSFNSVIEPIKSVAGQNNLTSTQVVNAVSAPGQNNLNSSVTPIFFGSGLANASLFKK